MDTPTSKRRIEEVSPASDSSSPLWKKQVENIVFTSENKMATNADIMDIDEDPFKEAPLWARMINTNVQMTLKEAILMYALKKSRVICRKSKPVLMKLKRCQQ